MHEDPTERAIDPRGSESLGRRLLRQRMFPSESAPTRVARYTILRFLGAGGMGQVYAAYDPNLDRTVALKLLAGGAADDLERRTRLLREAQALAKLSHPNVVQVYETGEHEGRVFIAMEYVPGATLGEWMQGEAGERPSKHAIVQAFLAAGRGLAAAHAAGLVHRDFKPANVLIDAQGRARVLDFGLVLGLGDAERSDPRPAMQALDVELTTTGTLLGTPAYMAPEQFDGVAADARTDQFGFCIALYEALVGERPFVGTTLAEQMASVHAGLRMSSAALALPRRVRRVLERGLLADPQRRWPSMDALLAELEPPTRWQQLVRVGALSLPFVALAGWAIVANYEQQLEQGAEQLAEVSESATVERERADRLASERALVERAKASVEVGELARTPGRELDALAQGVELLAADSGEADAELLAPALRGMALALDGVLPLSDLEQPDHVVFRAAISASGRHVVTTGLPGTHTIELWSGEPLAARRIELDAFEASLHAPQIDDRDRFAALGSTSRCLVISLEDGALVHELEGCTDPIFAGELLVGERVCKGGEGCGFAAWSLTSGELLWSQPSPGRALTLLADPAGERLFVRHDASVGGALASHALADGARLTWLQKPRESTLPAHVLDKVPLNDGLLALSGDGRWLAAVDQALGEAGSIAVWELETGRSRTLAVQPSVWGWTMARLSLNQSGVGLLVTGRGGGFWHHGVKMDMPTSMHAMGSSQGLFRGDEVIAFADGVWLSNTGGSTRQRALGGDALLADREGRRVVTAGYGRSHVWSREPHLALDRWVAPRSEDIVGFSVDRVVTKDRTGTVRVYARDGASEHEPLDSLALGKPSRIEVAAERPTRLVARLAKGLEFHALGEAREPCHVPAGTHWALDHAGTRLAVLDEAGARVQLWDLDRCGEIDGFAVPSGTWQDMEFVASGALSLRSLEGLTLVRSAGGQLHRIDEACTAGLTTGYASLSPDGRLLLTSCDAVTPEHAPGRVWDVERGAALHTIDLRGYTMRGRWSVDGTQLLFDAGDWQVAIVDLARGRERLRLPGRLMPDTAQRLGEGVLELVVHDYGKMEEALVRMPSDAAHLREAACRVLARSELAARVEPSCAAHVKAR
jgi:hypothetical protein